MSRKHLGYMIFFAVLVIVFYVLITALIPEFSKGRAAPIGYIGPFSFTNQDGKQVTEKDVHGKVYVAEYFFTTCKGICPRMNNNMLKVYEQLKDEEQFMILSHTSDPGTDSAARLKAYADSLKVSTKSWQFLTGSKDSLYKVARHMYQIDDPHNILSNESVDFLHTQFVALVDQNGDVRKVYDALKPSEMNELVSDAKDLIQNPPKAN